MVMSTKRFDPLRAVAALLMVATAWLGYNATADQEVRVVVLTDENPIP